LEILEPASSFQSLPFVCIGKGREPDEALWVVEPELPSLGEWQFRLNLGDDRQPFPELNHHYKTGLHYFWIQDGQIFDQRPALRVSPSRVIKIPEFRGRLPKRPLYIYLPRGYDEHTQRRYPVIYMHDGQNCFEAFVEDSFAGSWQADRVADYLISQGRMRECIIVGVSNGRYRRMVEYLPPYATCPPKWLRYGSTTNATGKLNRLKPVRGRANQTLAYYRDDVVLYISQHYRVLDDRENRATCGSSMGGLFSAYLAWEHPEFARHHAIMSPSFWITRTRQGPMRTIERLRTGHPRDIRLWLDSGTVNDGLEQTLAARDALLENGYIEGSNFRHYIDEGASHNEAAWAGRLPLIFQFLFPLD
jgi:predicted alpha/beta superfamily hydrolase